MSFDTLFAGLVRKAGSCTVRTGGNANGAKYGFASKVPASKYKAPDAKKSAVADFASKLVDTSVVRATETVTHEDGSVQRVATDTTGAEFREVLTAKA